MFNFHSNLQVPHAELEAWLVQREPDLRRGRDPPSVDREQTGPPVEPRAGGGFLQEEEPPDDTEVQQLHTRSTQ